MSDPHATYDVRCPVHGFITLNEWERDILAVPAFQRLRRIRQLAWTDQVYPGATHTRFEHSLGVMHTATLLYDSIRSRSYSVLRADLEYTDAGLERDRTLVRLAALLHDVGHGPFSHASEELFPPQPDGKRRYKHEHYSAAIVRSHFRDVIENHRLNQNYGFKAEDIAALLEGRASAGRALFWRDLIIGQLDADRMDYLLRDSLHSGVQYGRYDMQRLIRTVEIVPRLGGNDDGANTGSSFSNDRQGLRLGVSEGGWHAAEALILARYLMFTQVYFHKTRVAYDYHLEQAMKAILPAGVFPTPSFDQDTVGNVPLDEYLAWDDWRVFGMLSDGKGGDHGRRLTSRNHYREVYHTPESPTEADLSRLAEATDALGDLLAVTRSARKDSWYNLGVNQDSSK